MAFLTGGDGFRASAVSNRGRCDGGALERKVLPHLVGGVGISGNAVSDGLVAIVPGLRAQPRFLVSKGGITSSDVATKALGIRRAVVLGQAAPVGQLSA